MALGATLRNVGLAAALAVSLAACNRGPGGEAAPESGDKAVAKVDGRPVWVSDVKREAVAQGLIGEGEPLDASSDLFRQMMDEVIDQKLLAAEAVRRKLDKDAVAQRKLQAAHDRVLGDILVDATVADAVTESNIKGLYDEQQKLASAARRSTPARSWLATPAESRRCASWWRPGGPSRRWRWRSRATRPPGFNGGDLGYFTTDVMPEAYEAALRGAKAGQVIGPIPVARRLRPGEGRGRARGTAGEPGRRPPADSSASSPTTAYATCWKSCAPRPRSRP
jgi:peptidyl-prolyl cis-trans isomerase C